MDANERRKEITAILERTGNPVSASRLAAKLGVSRQVIVGDIALLRAQGSDIVATARGYIRAPSASSGRYVGKIACQHRPEDTALELSAIVRLGGKVVDVVVAHELYGEIVGQLNIATQDDVDDFIRRVKRNEARLLSHLTDGIHLHTISCPDKAAFDRINAELDSMGLLYSEQKD